MSGAGRDRAGDGRAITRVRASARFRSRLAAWLGICLAACSLPAWPDGGARAVGLDPAALAVAADLTTESGRTRLVVTLSRPVAAHGFVLERPDRAIIDLPEVTFQLPPGSGRARAGLVSSFRYGLFAPGRSRLVLDLSGPASLQRIAWSAGPVAGTALLTVELGRTDRDSFRRSARTVAPDPVSVAAAPSNPEDRRPVVAIDAGHGGIDPGASAPSGALEKDIVLAFGQSLRDRLVASGRYRVVMTRDSDVFVPLDERVARARAAGAELFLSVHADSISNPAIGGATLYTGSEQASDGDAATLAERENASDAAAGAVSGIEPAGVQDILQELTMRETRVFSHRLATELFDRLNPFVRFSSHPHREAGFRVLRAPDIPSVLLEVGYLTNGRDAGLMVSAAWREKATAAMTAALDRFFGSRVAGATAAVTTAAVSP